MEIQNRNVYSSDVYVVERSTKNVSGLKKKETEIEKKNKAASR